MTRARPGHGPQYPVAIRIGPGDSDVSGRADEEIPSHAVTGTTRNLANRPLTRHTVDAKASPSGAGVVPGGGDGRAVSKAGAVRRRPAATRHGARART